MNMPRALDMALHAELQQLLGDRVTTSRAVREHHGKDQSYYPARAPDAVVFPRSTEEVADIVNLCRRYQTPIIPFGAGRSVEGHVLAVHGGVCMDLSRMNQVLAIHVDHLEDLAEAHAFNARIVERALAMEGTCTGEHGVGLGKMDWPRKEHGDAVDLMAAIKRTLDPENLLNPGKVADLQR